MRLRSRKIELQNFPPRHSGTKLSFVILCKAVEPESGNRLHTPQEQFKFTTFVWAYAGRKLDLIHATAATL
jgi:hypothetical protein